MIRSTTTRTEKHHSLSLTYEDLVEIVRRAEGWESPPPSLTVSGHVAEVTYQGTPILQPGDTITFQWDEYPTEDTPKPHHVDLPGDPDAL